MDEQVEDFVLNNNTKLESTKDEKKEAKKNFRDGLEKKIMAIAILKRADKKRYGNLQTERYNKYLKRKDEFPKDVPSVLNLLDNYKPAFKPRVNNNNNSGQRNNEQQQLRNGNTLVLFLQSEC